MRVALVSPYSWSYPGGVTRHIDALARQLRAIGHDVRILAPFDPDDRLARRLHGGARPQPMAVPDGLISLGRTVGIPANGAVSNVAISREAVLGVRRELRSGAYDVVHIHEPIAAIVGWDAMCCADPALPLVGTFHAYSENPLSNGSAWLMGASRRMNRLRVRIAVSEAAAWTARRFFGGRYEIVPNGVHLGAGGCTARLGPVTPDRPLRIVFVGQAVGRKGLPVLLRAFEALGDHVPATLTLVGASPDEVAHMMLDGHGVEALGKVSDEVKLAHLREADVLCAPSLHGESFGMVLTEAFAAGTPVIASDIPGYRDVARHGHEGLLVPPNDAVAVAEALRTLALDDDRRLAMATAASRRAERFSWPQVADEVVELYERAIAVPRPEAGLQRAAVGVGLVPADGGEAVPHRRLASLEPASRRSTGQRVLRLAGRVAGAAVSAALLTLATIALVRIGVAQVVASLVASRPDFVLIGLGLMCAAMVARGVAWHAILRAAPGSRHVRRRDALRGTFIGVLMSATLPARLGEPARALVVARRLGRARETLPVVAGTMIFQSLLNLVVLALLGASMLSTINLLDGRHGALLIATLAPVSMLAVLMLAPLMPRGPDSRSVRLAAMLARVHASALRVRDGLGVFQRPRLAAAATAVQLGAWALQWLSCFLLLMAFGLEHRVGLAGAAGVLFAVNVTALIPATPANLGVFQAACAVVLHGAFHVGVPAALAYGLTLQAVEVATAVIMGAPALMQEGMSWRDLRRRAMHASPVQLSPLPPLPVRSSAPLA